MEIAKDFLVSVAETFNLNASSFCEQVMEMLKEYESDDLYTKDEALAEIFSYLLEVNVKSVGGDYLVIEPKEPAYYDLSEYYIDLKGDYYCDQMREQREANEQAQREWCEFRDDIERWVHA